MSKPSLYKEIFHNSQLQSCQQAQGHAFIGIAEMLGTLCFRATLYKGR